jgi:hypothetical protein
MPSDNEQKDGFLLSIWQAITLVGDARERSDEIDPSELETVLAEAESLLIGAVSEAAQHPAKPARQRRWLRFWKAAADPPSREISWSESTAVIPFPGLRIAESTVLRTGTIHAVNRPPQLPRPGSGGARAEVGLPQPSDGRIGRALRLALYAGLTILPLLASQAWLELDLRSERQAAIRESVVYRVRQLAADIAELREGARQLLVAIGQLDAVRFRQTEACSGLLAKLRSRYPNYALLGAADSQGRIFCASGPAPASVRDQSFFTRAVAHDGLVVGNYWVDPADGEKMINFAVQITDATGLPAGVIFAGLDLAWLSDHLKESGLPPTSSKLIADRDGNIIARLPAPEDFVGRNMRASHERIMDGGEAGWEEVTGVDGVTRIFGYVPTSMPPKDFFLSIGEAKRQSFAAINAATWRDATVLLVGLLGSIGAAWAGRNLVFSPTQGSRQPAAQHHQFDRENGVAVAKSSASAGIAPPQGVSLGVGSPIDGRFVFSRFWIGATYFARGPPRQHQKDPSPRAVMRAVRGDTNRPSGQR